LTNKRLKITHFISRDHTMLFSASQRTTQSDTARKSGKEERKER
jgi:hypothetical protein